MKKVLKLTLALAMVLCSTSAMAQKLARVNTQEIFAQMAETKQMQENLDAFGKELQAEFEKNQATMNPTVKQMKEAELNGLQQRYAEFQQIAQQDFAKKQQELADPIQKKLNEAIAKVAKAAGYSAVLDEMAFVYYDPAQVADINGAVKKELGITEAAK